MIEINLLPESLRKTEGTPLGRFMAYCLGVILVCSLGAYVAHHHFVHTRDVEDELQRKIAEKTKAETTAKELDEINAKLDLIQARVNAIKELYRGRMIWSKLLYDFRKIVTFDATANEANPELRYLWVTKVVASVGSKLEMEGYASAPTEVVAVRLEEDFLKQLREYSASQAPEVEERERLEQMLMEAKKSWHKIRSENPELPPVSPDEKELKEKLALVEKRESGGVAEMPFINFFREGSPILDETSWQAGGLNADRELKGAAFLPVGAYRFKINMNLKTPQEIE
jgi:hypothetical protein